MAEERRYRFGDVNIIEITCDTGLVQIAFMSPSDALLVLVENEFALTGLVGWNVYANETPLSFADRKRAWHWAYSHAQNIVSPPPDDFQDWTMDDSGLARAGFVIYRDTMLPSTQKETHHVG